MPKISQYPSMTTLTGSEILVGDQGALTSTGTATQIATFAQGGFQFTDTGAANAYVLNSLKPLALNPGQLVAFNPLHANTGPSTATINGGGAVAIQDSQGNALIGGELLGPVILFWTGAVLRLFWVLPIANTYTAAEVSAAASLSITVAALVPKPWFPVGDLRRYGCDVTGGTDNTVQITNAIAAAVANSGCGFIYHPGGTISHASQITIVNNLAIVGLSRAKSVFSFTGSPGGSPAATRSAWRYTGVAPWSGYANVFIRDVQFNYQNAINFAAAVELSAWGWAYFVLERVWIKGSCSYGLILDGTEICGVHDCLIENINAVANTNIWIVNGADRGFNPSGGSPLGFSNVITIDGPCQISSNSAVSVGLQDDGGNGHVTSGNNFNGHRFPAVLSACTNSKFVGNSLETAQQLGSANLLIQSTSGAGNPVGACTGLLIAANGFYGNMSAGSLLTFAGTAFNISAITQAATGVVTFSTVSTVNPFVVSQQIAFAGITGMTQLNGQSAFVLAIGGASGAWTATINLNTSTYSAYVSGGTGKLFHTGIKVQDNTFGAQLGRGNAIDVTYLGNSVCEANNDQAMSSPGGASMGHYTGVHNDQWGNRLERPQNGGIAPGNEGISGPTYGDTRSQVIFQQGQALVRTAITYSASMTVDVSQANYFTISATSGAAFTINAPLNPLGGEQIQFIIRNASGGALGAITWNAVFKINATAIAPANGQSRSIAFLYDGSNWVEQWRSANDIPN